MKIFEGVFNEIEFVASDHAIDQWKERSELHNPTKESLLENIRAGVWVSQNHGNDYVRNGNYIYPCIKQNGIYLIKTVLTEQMVYNRFYK